MRDKSMNTRWIEVDPPGTGGAPSEKVWCGSRFSTGDDDEVNLPLPSPTSFCWEQPEWWYLYDEYSGSNLGEN
jgi:hypothetical protein